MPVIATSPPDRGALSGLLAGVSFLAGVAGAIALAEGPFPRPGSDPAQIRRYFTQNAGPARLSAAGQAFSAASLVQFTASVAKLAARTGRGSRALRAAAVAGGGLAAASLATSAVTHAMLTGQNDDDDAARLARREFVAGGPVHGVGFGVLTGVLALAGLRTGELPRRWRSPGWSRRPRACSRRSTSSGSPRGGSSRPGGSPGWWSAASPGSGSPAAHARSSGPQTSRSAEGTPNGCTAQIHGLGNGPARRR